MLRFMNADLRPVLLEARKHGCKVILVKDEGIYMMSDIGDKDSNGRHKLLAYAVGFDPAVDRGWFQAARLEVGGDDFGEELDVTDPVFLHILRSQDDLTISFTKTHMRLQPAQPTAETPPRQPFDPRSDHPEFFCLDCDADTLENGHYYMLHDKVWLAVHPVGHGMLCLECVEARLGRPLTKDDFAQTPINQLEAARCPALALRLTRSPH